jgi:hypothetical protein
MACVYESDSETLRRQGNTLVSLTNILCGVMKHLEASGKLDGLPEDSRIWWRAHKKNIDDKKREDREYNKRIEEKEKKELERLKSKYQPNT